MDWEWIHDTIMEYLQEGGLTDDDLDELYGDIKECSKDIAETIEDMVIPQLLEDMGEGE